MPKSIINNIINTTVRQTTRNVVNSIYYGKNETPFEQALNRKQAQIENARNINIVWQGFTGELGDILKDKEFSNNYIVFSTESEKIDFESFCSKNNYLITNNKVSLPVEQHIRDRRKKEGWRCEYELMDFYLITQIDKEILENQIRENAEREQKLITKKKRIKKIIWWSLYIATILLFIYYLYSIHHTVDLKITLVAILFSSIIIGIIRFFSYLIKLCIESLQQ